MAAIGDAMIRETWHNDSVWEFEISYKAYFAPDEKNQNFNDSVKLWEQDDENPNPFGGDDDEITAYLPVETFPSGLDTAVERKRRITALADQLDTDEFGNEYIYGQIWLRKQASNGPADAEVHTAAISIDP
jgi:hypothetical protein